MKGKNPYIYICHQLTFLKWKEVNVKVPQSCLTLCDPMYYTAHEILQARILEWVVFPFSRGSSQPRDWTQVSRIAGRFFTSWATREVQHFLLIEKNISQAHENAVFEDTQISSVWVKLFFEVAPDFHRRTLQCTKWGVEASRMEFTKFPETLLIQNNQPPEEEHFYLCSYSPH